MKNRASMKCHSIFDPGIARHLLRKGHTICDIKPKKENLDASIFLFEETEQFKADLADVLAKIMLQKKNEIEK